MIHLRPGSRARPTLRQYLSPLFWATDTEMDPGWTRRGWFLRNPMYNALAVIVGVAHLPRLTATTEPQGRTFPTWGLVVASTLCFRFGCVPVCLPWIAWRGLGVEAGAGWKMSGNFSITARRQGAKNATEVAPS